jgi:hypothetical protein
MVLGAVAVAGLAGCVIQVPPGEILGWAPPPAPAPVVVYQQPPPAEYAQPAAAQESSNEDLQRLVAPIALYPDPLLADILPASTFPDQIQAAEQFVQANPAPPEDEIAAQPWDPSVQALVHYPMVLAYMSEEIGWTRSLGSAVTTEQPDVMASIQDLRAKALADGGLHDTPEQRVVVEGDPIIYILPAQPDEIFVPVYDPVLVYSGPVEITFGPRFVAGAWLGYGFDWDHHWFYHGDWHGGWAYGPGGWHRDLYWHAPDRGWERDRRWGEPPQVYHYEFRHEVARAQWHLVEAGHRQEVQHLRRAGELPQPGHNPSVGHTGVSGGRPAYPSPSPQHPGAGQRPYSNGGRITPPKPAAVHQPPLPKQAPTQGQGGPEK